MVDDTPESGQVPAQAACRSVPLFPHVKGAHNSRALLAVEDGPFNPGGLHAPPPPSPSGPLTHTRPTPPGTAAGIGLHL